MRLTQSVKRAFLNAHLRYCSGRDDDTTQRYFTPIVKKELAKVVPPSLLKSWLSLPEHDMVNRKFGVRLLFGDEVEKHYLAVILPGIYELYHNRVSDIRLPLEEKEHFRPLARQRQKLAVLLDTQTTVEGFLELRPDTKPVVEELLGVKL